MAATIANSRISPKEQAWIESYLQHFNATQAARDAGYKWPEKIGWRKKEKFADLITAELEARAMTTDEALRRLAERATFDVSPYLRWDSAGHVRVDLEALIAAGHGRHIKGIVHGRHGDRILFHDSQDALFLLARVLGLESAAEGDKTIRIVVERDPEYGRARITD